MDIIEEIEFKGFPTHIQVTKGRRKDGKIIPIPRYKKINGQYIYNGAWSPVLRSFIVNAMHEYVKDAAPKSKKYPKSKLPILVRAEVYVPFSYGRISMRNGEHHIPIVPLGKAEWDVHNLFGYLWTKVFEDFLTQSGRIPDDNVQYVRGSGEVFFVHPVPFEERKLVFKIYSLTSSEKWKQLQKQKT